MYVKVYGCGGIIHRMQTAKQLGQWHLLALAFKNISGT